MKVLIIGGGGMLGHKLVQILQNRFEVWTTIRDNFNKFEKYSIFDKQKTFENINVENINQLEALTNELRPDVIINAVGVIKQVPSAKNVVKTLMANAIFPHQLLEISEKIQARLINISTDCVFDGKKGSYTETDISNASDVYGKSKCLGETISENSITIRTSIIGRELNSSHSLVEWFLSNGGGTVKGFTKAIFSGFPTIVLAEIIADLIDKHPNLQGLYHVSSEPINKYDLLNLLKEAYQINVQIEPSEDLEIDRSLDSTKFRTETAFQPLDWRKMIEKMAEDNALYQNTK